MSEDGVTVTSADGEAEDGALRALREDQAKLDAAWNKRKRALKRYPFLECLTTQKIEVKPRISPAEPRSVTKRWFVCKGCNRDAGGINSSRWLEHVLHCEPLAQAARDESATGAGEMKNAFIQLSRLTFKLESSRTRVHELRAFFSPGWRSNTSETGTTATTTTVVESTAQTDLRRYLRPPLSKKDIADINDAVSELIVESSIPLSWTSSPAFFKFIHALRPDLFNDTEKASIASGTVLVNQPKNIRSRHWQATTGLDRLYEKRMQAALKEIEESEELALAADGWQAEHGRKVLNVAITMRETGREYYWKSVELGTESENAAFMQQAVAQVMSGLPLKKFKCIIGDNTGHVIKFLETITSTPQFSHVTPIGCFAHRFNLLAGDVVEVFKYFFVQLEQAINKLHVKTQMRALFDAVRKEKKVAKQLETYCQTRWASAHVCLSSYVANIDVLRFLDEDGGVVAKDFRKLRTSDPEIFDVLFSREAQMAARHLESLFRGLAAANKFVEAADAHLAEIFPLCWALDNDMKQWLANAKTNGNQSWIACATCNKARDASTCTTPEELSVVLKRVYQVRFEGLEAQPGKPSTRRQPLRDDPLVHLASSLSFMLHKRMRIKSHKVVPNTFMAQDGLRKIHFHLEEVAHIPDVEAADLAVENMNATVIPEHAKKFQNHYCHLFTNEAYVEACTDRTFVDVTLEQLEYIRQHNWWRNLLEMEEVVNWSEWKPLIPYARRVNAIVPHSASVERMNSAQKLVHNKKRTSLSHARIQKLTFVYFNSRHKRRVTASSFGRLAAEACEVTENEIVASPVVVDADGDDDADDDGVGADEILSSDDESLDDYLKDADELVMSPFADVSNRTETTCVGNLDENVPVEDDDSRPARDKEKETFAQKAARKALERQEKERRSKHRRLNQ